MDGTECARACRALSDETRLRIAGMLSSEEQLCACDLLEHLEISQPTLSYHMKLLIESGLVLGEKHGQWMRYRLDAAIFAELRDFIEALSTTQGAGDEGRKLLYRNRKDLA